MVKVGEDRITTLITDHVVASLTMIHFLREVLVAASLVAVAAAEDLVVDSEAALAVSEAALADSEAEASEAEAEAALGNKKLKVKAFLSET